MHKDTIRQGKEDHPVIKGKNRGGEVRNNPARVITLTRVS